MSDLPPDPSAHDQVHDWSVERGMQTVGILRASIMCPKCWASMGIYRNYDQHYGNGLWAFIAHYGRKEDGACIDSGKLWRVPIAALVEVYPCEELPLNEYEARLREVRSAIRAHGIDIPVEPIDEPPHMGGTRESYGINGRAVYMAQDGEDQ